MMKMFSLILVGLLLLALSLGAFAQPAAPEPPEDDFMIAQLPPTGGGGPSMRGGPGMMAESPELISLVQDISALRQINRADLSAKQIGDILPVLQNLEKQQKAMLSRVKKNLQAERARLLKAQGPDSDKGRSKMRESAGDYRKDVEAAQAKISKLLNTSQAKVINEMIAPPKLDLDTGARTTQKDQKKETSDRERLRELRQNRFGGGHPPVALSRLISLLKEKQKALK